MYKIIQINSCANSGSTGKIAEQINLIAASCGWKTYIAYGRSVNPSRSQLIHIGGLFSQAIALFEARFLDNEGLASYFATKRLIKKIKNISPDIIHLHNLHGYYLNYRLLFKYLNTSKVPVVWTLHDCWSFTGHCAHFVTVNCEKWKVLCVDCPLKKSYPKSIWRDNSKRNYLLKKKLFCGNPNLHVVSVSKWLANILKDSYLCGTDIRMISNGIDLSVFKEEKLSREKKSFTLIGVAGKWTKEKGLYDYYKLREKLPNHYYRIVLIGLTQQQIRSLPDGIEGICHTDSVTELVTLYSGADVVLSLSRGETLASTPLEGMACGTPAIVYDNTAQPELVTAETGLVVEQGNIEMLVGAIKEIQKNGRSSYSEACKQRIELFYNKEKQFRKYIELYEEILNH